MTFIAESTPKKLFFIALLLFAGAAMLLADNTNTEPGNKGKISGNVFDTAEQEGIPYATVSLYNQADSNLVTGTITDDAGHFAIQLIPDGEYYLVVNFIGYSKKVIHDLQIGESKKNIQVGDVQLNRAVQQLGEVEVTAEKHAVQYAIDKKVVNVQKNLQAAGGTVANALETVPSVKIDAEGNVSLRGSESFTVLIDGKPTALKGADALKQIPASAVDQVEIITNPSAKYDPDGTAGIINIIMKKEFQNGLNGMINASVGSNWTHNGDFMMNYRSGEVNCFIGGQYGERKMYPTTTFSRETYWEDTTRFVAQDGNRIQGNRSYSIKGGADFYLTDKNTLTASGEYGYWGFGMIMNSKTKETTIPVSENIYKSAMADMGVGGNYMNGALTFDHDFAKDHDLVTSVFLSSWDGSNGTDTEERTTDRQWDQVFSRSRHQDVQHTNNYELRFKVDYRRPLGEKSNIEAGYQFRMKDENGNYAYEIFQPDQNSWEEIPEFTNSMAFTRRIQSLYGTLRSEIAGFHYQLGIRGEYTDRAMVQHTAEEDYNRRSLDFFPTVHVQRQLSEMQEIQAGYSRRVNRPQSWHLNPFPIYSDSYMWQSGNPNLQPEFTDSYELNYMQRFSVGYASAEAFYRQTNNSYQRTIDLDDEGRAAIQTINLDKTYAYGVEIATNLRFAKWLNINASANIYNYSIEGEEISAGVDVNSLKTDFQLNTSVKLGQSTRLQFSGFYNAPTITSQGVRSELYGFNAAINQEFFQQKLSVTLNARDIFSTMKSQFNAHGEHIYTEFTYNMDSPVITLSLSYKINNYKHRKTDPDMQPVFGGGGS